MRHTPCRTSKHFAWKMRSRTERRKCCPTVAAENTLVEDVEEVHKANDAAAEFCCPEARIVHGSLRRPSPASF
jgi:hypothetical protein